MKGHAQAVINRDEVERAMPAGWSLSASVRAPADAVYAWLTDYSDDDHSNERFKRGARAARDDKISHRVVERRDARHLVVTDAWGKKTFTVQVELAPEAREVRLRGEFGYHGVWKASPEGLGTRVTSVGKLAPAGIAKLFARKLAKQMKDDFDGHVADLRSALEGPA